MEIWRVNFLSLFPVVDFLTSQKSRNELIVKGRETAVAWSREIQLPALPSAPVSPRGSPKHCSGTSPFLPGITRPILQQFSNRAVYERYVLLRACDVGWWNYALKVCLNMSKVTV